MNVIDDETINIETLVVGVGLGIAEQLQQELGGLLAPATLCGLALFGLGATVDTTVEATEWHALLLLHDSLQKLWARHRGMRLMAWAVSCVFLKCTRRLRPRDFFLLVKLNRKRFKKW